jgi:hypothetical protein
MAFFLFAVVGALPSWGEPPDVFQPANMPPRNVRLGPHIVQFQPALVNLDALSSTTTGTRLALNVLPDGSFVGVVDQIEWRGEHRFTIAGHLEDVEHGSFMIVVEQDVAVGTIRAPTLDRLFELRYAGDGIHLICDIDSSLLLPEADPLPTGEPPIMEPREIPDLPPSEEWRTQGEPSRADPCQRPPPVFDVMIFYTSLARDAVGGTSAINALCQWAVDENNRIYDNSRINARMRLVYRGVISYDESGTDQEHLDRLTGQDDGVMDGVHSLRDEYGADFVSLLVDDDQASGIGWCSANENMAFSVVNWQFVTPKFTVSHEIGHNLGCQHNRENNNPTGCNLYSYSFGWHYEGDSGTEHGTVMSYLGARIPYFSNPEVSFDGHATGVPIGETDEAHNAETIQQRRSACEDFRGTQFETWVDFDAFPIGFGTFDFPYDTLVTGVDELFTVPSGSVLPELWIKNGATDETLTISKRMVIRSCGGTVRIGAQP